MAISKLDSSPVTVADFCAQAVISHHLHRFFPEDPVCGEEDASDLQEPSSPIVGSILQELNGVMSSSVDHAALIRLIDRCKYQGGAKGRFWTVDPVDGTKGFLRKDQYAVCLALISDGQVKLGVIGCPNMSLPASNDAGVLFGAVEGQGAFYQPLDQTETDSGRTPIKVSPTINTKDACFCESFESSHSDQTWSEQIAKQLQISRHPLRMDSQCKYGAIASGKADIYLRLPTRAGYQEKIWDHASGDLIVREAGGSVTDINGKRLDFSQGKLLSNNMGVVASNGLVHAKVLEAIRQNRQQQRDQ